MMLISEYVCIECNNRRFPNERALHAHQTRQHNRAPFFSSYKRKSDRQTPARPVICYTCNIVLRNSQAFRDHIKEAH